MAAIKLPSTFWPDSFACLTGHATPAVIDHLHAELTPLHRTCASAGQIFPLFIA